MKLACFGGPTQSESAARLGEPLGTARTRMRSGLEQPRGLPAAGTASRRP